MTLSEALRLPLPCLLLVPFVSLIAASGAASRAPFTIVPASRTYLSHASPLFRTRGRGRARSPRLPVAMASTAFVAAKFLPAHVNSSPRITPHRVAPTANLSFFPLSASSSSLLQFQSPSPSGPGGRLPPPPPPAAWTPAGAKAAARASRPTRSSRSRCSWRSSSATPPVCSVTWPRSRTAALLVVAPLAAAVPAALLAATPSTSCTGKVAPGEAGEGPLGSVLPSCL